MGAIFWTGLAVLGLMVIVVSIAVAIAVRNRRRGIRRETNYRAFFIVGLCMFPLGITGVILYSIFNIPVVAAMLFFTLGIVYVAIGLSKRDTWYKADID
jgi:glucose uptake protein GlcU